MSSNWPEELTAIVSISLIISLFVLINMASVQAAWTASDFFVDYDVNMMDLAEFNINVTLKNPTASDITINDLSRFRTRYINALGKGIDSIELRIWKNVTHSITRNNVSTTCDPVQTWKCTDTVTGTYTISWTSEETVPLELPVTFRAGRTAKLNVIAHKKPSIGKTANDIFIGLNVSGTMYERPDWVWWNTTWESKLPINVSIGASINYYQLPVDIAKTADMTSNCDEGRFVNASENALLPYYFWDSNATHCKFIVNVSLSNANGTQAYYYFANTSSVSSLSSGSQTFICYDNFESGNLNYWTTTTGASVNSTVAYRGTYSAKVGTNLLKSGCGSDATGERLIYAEQISSSGTDFYAGMTNASSGDYVLYGRSGGDSTSNYTGLVTTQTVSQQALTTNVWKIHDIKTASGANTLYSTNYTQKLSKNQVKQVDQMKFYIPADSLQMIIDEVAMMKWVFPEPTVAFGTRENNTGTPAVNGVPQWSNNVTKWGWGEMQYYPNSPVDHGFQINAVSNLTNVNFYSNITGVNRTYNTTTSPAVVNSSNIYWINFTGGLPAGASAFQWTMTNTSGTNSTPSWLYNISRMASEFNVIFTPNTDNFNFGSDFTVNCDIQTGTSIDTSGWRNDTFLTKTVTSTDFDIWTTATNGYVPVGYWVFKCNVSETQNYTESSTSRGVTVNKATPTISLYLNGTQSNKSYIFNQVANFTALSSVSGLPVNITSNYTGFGTLKGTTSIVNYTTLSNASSATYNITAWTDGNANYTSASVTYFFTVSNYTLTVLNTSYNASVIEGLANNLVYEAYVTNNNAFDINATFYFNGTAFPVANELNISGTYRFNITLSGFVNSSSAAVLNESSPFYWSFRSYNSGGTLLSTDNSSTNNQTIHKIYLGNCSDGRSGQETLHFYLYDEENMAVPVNGTITPNFGDVSYQSGAARNRTYSFSFANYTDKGICLYPTWANYYKTLASNVIVYYTATGYDSRYYYFNPNMTNSSQTVNLYLLSSSGSAVTSIYVYDTDGTPYEDATVDVQRYLTSNSTYVSVGQITTDFDGKGVIYLVPNTVYYRFIVKNSGGTVLRTFSSKIITCSPSDYTCPPYTVVLDLSQGQGVSDWFRYYDFQYTCTNTTTAIACSVVTTSGVMANTSFRVDNITTGLPLCIQNSSAASVTHTCTVGNMTNNAYQYYLYGYVSSSSQWVLLYQNFLEGPEWANSSAQSLNWGEWGLFLVIIMNLLLFLIGIWIPYVPNVLAIIGNIGMYAVGIFDISVTGIIAFTFIQITVIYLMSRLK